MEGEVIKLNVGPKSSDSALWLWMQGGRKKIYRVTLGEGEVYEGTLLDGTFHGRGKMR